MTPILIILQTYERTHYALETVRALKAGLPADACKWYIADDGSCEYHTTMLPAEIGAENIAGMHSKRISYGACANQAQVFADENGYDLTLWLEDDWKLYQPLDLAPYIEILQRNAAVGMVRLGRIPPGLDAKTEYYNGAGYLWYQPTAAYMFSGNPALRHRRFHQAFGDYPEREQPGETERIYEAHIRRVKDGPKIIQPIDIGTWGLFQHIGDVKSF